jgi:hypothetical protein
VLLVAWHPDYHLEDLIRDTQRLTVTPEPDTLQRAALILTHLHRYTTCQGGLRRRRRWDEPLHSLP